MPSLVDISQSEFVAAIRHLADRIAADPWRPHYIVGIGRGGLVPATYISHATALPLLSIDLSAGLHDFADALLVRLAARTRAGERLLLIDDINDSGGTIARLRRMLAEAGAIADHVRFAVLIDNCRSASRIDHAARTIDRAVTKDWFVFPWEALIEPVQTG